MGAVLAQENEDVLGLSSGATCCQRLACEDLPDEAFYIECQTPQYLACVVPPAVRVTSPNGQHGCEGVFLRVNNTMPNGFPLWRKQAPSTSDRWLYSSPDGSWNIGGSSSEKLDFECHSAYIFCKMKHFGVMPDQLSGVWWRVEGTSFVSDPEISVAAVQVVDISGMTASEQLCEAATSSEGSLSRGREAALTLTAKEGTTDFSNEEAPSEEGHKNRTVDPPPTVPGWLPSTPRSSPAPRTPRSPGTTARREWPFSRVSSARKIAEVAPSVDSVNVIMRKATMVRSPCAELETPIISPARTPPHGRSGCAPRTRSGSSTEVLGTPAQGRRLPTAISERTAGSSPCVKVAFWPSLRNRTRKLRFVFTSRPLGVKFEDGQTPMIVEVVCPGGVADNLGIEKGMALSEIEGLDVTRRPYTESFTLLTECCRRLPRTATTTRRK